MGSCSMNCPLKLSLRWLPARMNLALASFSILVWVSWLQSCFGHARAADMFPMLANLRRGAGIALTRAVIRVNAF